MRASHSLTIFTMKVADIEAAHGRGSNYVLNRSSNGWISIGERMWP